MVTLDSLIEKHDPEEVKSYEDAARINSVGNIFREHYRERPNMRDITFAYTCARKAGDLFNECMPVAVRERTPSIIGLVYSYAGDDARAAFIRSQKKEWAEKAIETYNRACEFFPPDDRQYTNTRMFIGGMALALSRHEEVENQLEYARMSAESYSEGIQYLRECRRNTIHARCNRASALARIHELTQDTEILSKLRRDVKKLSKVLRQDPVFQKTFKYLKGCDSRARSSRRG